MSEITIGYSEGAITISQYDRFEMVENVVTLSDKQAQELVKTEAATPTPCPRCATLEKALTGARDALNEAAKQFRLTDNPGHAAVMKDHVDASTKALSV